MTLLKQVNHRLLFLAFKTLFASKLPNFRHLLPKNQILAHQLFTYHPFLQNYSSFKKLLYQKGLTQTFYSNFMMYPHYHLVKDFLHILLNLQAIGCQEFSCQLDSDTFPTNHDLISWVFSLFQISCFGLWLSAQQLSSLIMYTLTKISKF